jgi:pimeloyl-ACP methyl ester carboxylesterase
MGPSGKRRFARAAVFAIAVLAGTSLAVVWRHYRADISDARKRVSASRIANTPCGQIEYSIVGEGPPVLVIHGAGGGFDQGQDLGEPLAHAGFRVIAMSRFGYLRTPVPEDASADAQARAHACLLDTLGIGRVAVMGASAGAPSATQFALRYPERTTRLVLLVPGLYAPRPEGVPSVTPPQGIRFVAASILESDFLMWAAIHAAPETMSQIVLGTPGKVIDAASDDERERLDRVLEHILPVASRRMGLYNDSAVIGSIPRFDLERIAVPTLVITAADDLYGTYDSGRYTAEHIAGAKFVGYPSGGHLLVGRERESSAEVVAFLGKNSGPQ